jgi:dihydroflavonol-4-reductase
MLTVVTGASGHIGANLVRALLEQGRRVRVVVHDSDVGLDGLGVERVLGDVRDPASMRAAFDGAQVVFHLAAIISIEGDPHGHVAAVNIQGARNVAEAALACGVRRLIHTSSIHAFDQYCARSGPLTEASARSKGPKLPAYDRSKAAGEAGVREVIAQGLDAVVVHPSGVVGPFDYRPSRMGQVLLDLYHRRLPALVPGGYNFVDVRDVVAGMLAAEKQGQRGESYLLAGEWAAVRTIAEIAARCTGVPAPRIVTPFWMAHVGVPFMTVWARLTKTHPIYTHESLGALKVDSKTDLAKARRDLGYVPRPLEDTIRDTYAWFRGAGMLRPS